MVETRILQLIKFIVATASRKGFNKLWTIHVVKYLYLADYYNSLSQKGTLTNWRWKFWDLGPWTTSSYAAIESAIQSGYIQSEMIQANSRSNSIDENNEYRAFYVGHDELTDAEYENLGRALIPDIRARMALESAIEKFGFKTNPLLHYVYKRTDPMQDVIKGDTLNFDGLSWPQNNVVENPKIKKRKIIKANGILEKIRQSASPRYSPPSGKFDEVYLQCMSSLNEQDNNEIEDGFEIISCVKDVNI